MRNRRVFCPGAFRCLCFDPHAIFGNGAQLGYSLTNRAGVRADLWRRQNQRRIEIDQRVARGRNALQSLAQKHGRVRPFPLWVTGRKERTDVGPGDCAEQSVGDGVQQHVSIGVAAKAFIVRKFDATDDERNSGRELVRVVALADAELGMVAQFEFRRRLNTY